MEPTCEDFQDSTLKGIKIKYMRISKMKYTRTLIFYFQRNEASVLEHIAPIYFPVYSVVVVLHVCVNECATILGFTRIDLSFLETSKSLGSCHRLRIA
jgi:hypothetical protein